MDYSGWQADVNQNVWQYGSAGWSLVPGAFVSVAAGGDGEVWAIQSSGKIFRRKPLNPDGSDWMPAQPPATPDGLIWRPADPPPSRFVWQQIAGTLASVAVGSGQVWGTDSSQKVYRWNGQGWDQLSGSLVSIAVGDDGQVWGIDGHQNIYQWSGRGWNPVQGSFVSIAVASDSLVYGVNGNKQIYQRNGSGWTQIPGSLSSIAAGGGEVWGLDNGLIYQVTTAGLVQKPGSSNSLSVASPSVSCISLASSPASPPLALTVDSRTNAALSAPVLGSGSNYVLYSDGNALTNVSVTMDVWETIGGSPGVGFSCQLNAYSAANANYNYQQYCITVDGTKPKPVIQCAICNWGVSPTYPLICTDFDLYPPTGIPWSLARYVIHSGWQLKIELINDSNGNINAARFAVVDSAGGYLANRTISLLSLTNTANASVTSADLAPIQAFELNIVGPNNGKNTVFSSGSGIITYAASNPLTALAQAPSGASAMLQAATQAHSTEESSNCAYGNLPAIPNTRLAQAFICVNAPPAWPVAVPT